ncbi:hypothetical protein D3C87_670700 [compost metagenome]
MRVRHALGVGVLAFSLLGSPALSQVGQTIQQFEMTPMLKKGVIAYVEPFELKDGTKGKTYRATETYFSACQIMVITNGNKIESEIFAMPLIDSEEILQAEKLLLDMFLSQSGLNAEGQKKAREQFIESIEQDQLTRKHGNHYVQTTMIAAEVPLLVMAIARDPSKLPFKETKAPKTRGPSSPLSIPL